MAFGVVLSIIKIQSVCRMFLCRKRYNKIRNINGKESHTDEKRRDDDRILNNDLSQDRSGNTNIQHNKDNNSQSQNQDKDFDVINSNKFAQRPHTHQESKPKKKVSFLDDSNSLLSNKSTFPSNSPLKSNNKYSSVNKLDPIDEFDENKTIKYNFAKPRKHKSNLPLYDSQLDRFISKMAKKSHEDDNIIDEHQYVSLTIESLSKSFSPTPLWSNLLEFEYQNFYKKTNNGMELFTRTRDYIWLTHDEYEGISELDINHMKQGRPIFYVSPKMQLTYKVPTNDAIITIQNLLKENYRSIRVKELTKNRQIYLMEVQSLKNKERKKMHRKLVAENNALNSLSPNDINIKENNNITNFTSNNINRNTNTNTNSNTNTNMSSPNKFSMLKPIEHKANQIMLNYNDLSQNALYKKHLQKSFDNLCLKLRKVVSKWLVDIYDSYSKFEHIYIRCAFNNSFLHTKIPKEVLPTKCLYHIVKTFSPYNIRFTNLKDFKADFQTQTIKYSDFNKWWLQHSFKPVTSADYAESFLTFKLAIETISPLPMTELLIIKNPLTLYEAFQLTFDGLGDNWYKLFFTFYPPKRPIPFSHFITISKNFYICITERLELELQYEFNRNGFLDINSFYDYLHQLSHSYVEPLRTIETPSLKNRPRRKKDTALDKAAESVNAMEIFKRCSQSYIKKVKENTHRDRVQRARSAAVKSTLTANRNATPISEQVIADLLRQTKLTSSDRDILENAEKAIQNSIRIQSNKHAPDYNSLISHNKMDTKASFMNEIEFDEY